MGKVWKRFAAIAGATMLSGCSVMEATIPDSIIDSFPETQARATATDFNYSLVCMDNLMVIHKSQPLMITAQGIYNFTSDHSLSSGGKEMLITAISHMSQRSNAIRFVAYGSDIKDILDLQGAHPDKASFRVPDYFIRGGITQHNKNLYTGQNGVGVSGDFGDEETVFSDSNQASYGTLSIDLTSGFVSNLQMVPGISSSNTLAITKTKNNSLTADLSIEVLGITYSLTENLNRDFNTVLRSLIQVGVIEIIGKLQKLPYWRCLENVGPNRERSVRLRTEYNSMRDNAVELVSFSQKYLKETGYFKGAVNGELTLSTKQAVQAFQQHHNLLATGEIDFDSFHIMMLYSPTEQSRGTSWWRDDAPFRGGVAPHSPAANVAIPTD
jgi:hypothetical protein